MDEYQQLLFYVSHSNLANQPDQRYWKLEKNESFSVKLFYRQLINGMISGPPVFPFKQIWKRNVPSRMAFFIWEACKGGILTTEMLMKRGWCMVNRCFMCKSSAESCNHLLLWCPMVYSLLTMIYRLFGIQWVMVGSVKDETWAWVGLCKKKNHLSLIPLSIF